LKTTNPLISHWFITGFVLFLLSSSFVFVHFYGVQWQHPVEESERIFWRTMFYILAILILPLTNLLRHIFLRLNQTMPLLDKNNLEKIAQKRYALTVLVSQSVMILIGFLGLFIFYLGDVINTFRILIGVAIMGAFLYRPKNAEYQQILNNLIDTK
jgi:MFS family permease